MHWCSPSQRSADALSLGKLPLAAFNELSLANLAQGSARLYEVDLPPPSSCSAQPLFISFHLLWRDGIIRISVSSNSCAITIAGLHLPPQCDNRLREEQRVHHTTSSPHFTWQPQHSPDPETVQSLDPSIGLRQGVRFHFTSVLLFSNDWRG